MDFVPIILAVVLTLGLMISAWRFGVANHLAAGLSAAAGIGVGIVTFVYLPGIVKNAVDVTLSTKVVVIISFITGLLLMGILRYALRAFFRMLFNADSPLHNLSDGPVGAVIALIPAAILLFVLGTGLRMTGTLMELRQLQNITRTGVQWGTKNYPEWPLTTRWRDTVESIPLATTILDPLDPVSRKPARNLTGLLIASKNTRLRKEFESTTQAGEIVKSQLFLDLEQNEDVIKLNEKNQRPALLLHPDVQAASGNSEIESDLAKLELKDMIDAFQKNDGTQEATAPTINGKQEVPPVGIPDTSDPFAN